MRRLRTLILFATLPLLAIACDDGTVSETDMASDAIGDPDVCETSGCPEGSAPCAEGDADCTEQRCGLWCAPSTCDACPPGAYMCTFETGCTEYENACGMTTMCTSCQPVDECPSGMQRCSGGDAECMRVANGCGGDNYCEWDCSAAPSPQCCAEGGGDVGAPAVCESTGWTCPDGFGQAACEAPPQSCADFGGDLCCSPNGLQAYAECPSPSQPMCESWGDLDTSGCDSRRDACDGFVGFRCCDGTDMAMPVCHPDGYLVCPAGQKPVDPNEFCE